MISSGTALAHLHTAVYVGNPFSIEGRALACESFYNGKLAVSDL